MYKEDIPEIEERTIKYFCDLDILAIVTLETTHVWQQIAPAIESTTDLWIECVAQMDGGPHAHFIIKDGFTECFGIVWGQDKHPARPTGIRVCRSIIFLMAKEDLKIAFDAAFSTSRLGKAMGCDKHA